MSDDNVVQLPPPTSAPDFLIGPFEEYRVVLEGKLIPNLTAFREGDSICLVLDRRLSISVPKDRAYDVAWLVANALAIGAGYPCFTADRKTEAFASNCIALGALPER